MTLNTETALPLLLAGGAWGCLLGLVLGSLATWLACAAQLRNLSVENHELRRRLLSRGGIVARPRP